MLKTCTIPPVASFPLRGHTAHHLQCTLLAPFLGIDIRHSTWIYAPVSSFKFLIILYIDIISQLLKLDRFFTWQSFMLGYVDRAHSYVCIYIIHTQTTLIAYVFIFLRRILNT